MIHSLIDTLMHPITSPTPRHTSFHVFKNINRCLGVFVNIYKLEINVIESY